MKAFFANRWLRGILALFLLAAVFFGYQWWSEREGVTQTTAALVLAEVATGPVTSGIRTTGTIEAAEVLDLNVYKLDARIEELAVVNGAHVGVGDLILAFDESDAAVAIAESQLSIREAQLALDTKREEVRDPSTLIASLRNDIVVLERALVEHKKDADEALRDFLNADLTAEPSARRYEDQVTRTAPGIGGLFSGDSRGTYKIYVYASGAESGYSYRLEGLESGTFDVFPNASTPLGTRGLMITFPSIIDRRDEWVVAVPNTYAPEYTKNALDYERRMTDIETSIRNDTVSLANKRTALAQAERADTDATRAIEVDTSSLAIQKAQVTMQKNRDTKLERRVVAPFAGTVEGMSNVVVGATPSRESTDSVDFGVLISDDFLASFALSASDVDKVAVGDRVIVTLTTVPGSDPLEAEITEVSSLPDSGAVAQYAVKARILETASSTVRLRDGMLTDIEIVKESREGVVRVPVAALTYANGTAQVTLIEGLSEEQERQFSRMGVVRTDGSTHTTYTRTVTVGLRGTYYAEIVEGLTPGERIVVGTSAPAANAGEGVVRTGFGAGMGANHPPTADRD